MSKIIHLSLFPNSNCVICQKKVKEGWLHCEKCLDKYLESKEKKDKSNGRLFMLMCLSRISRIR